jgi:hypothetical protein
MNDSSCSISSLSRCICSILFWATPLSVLFLQARVSIAQSGGDQSIAASIEQNPQGNTPQTASKDADGNFFERLGHFYAADWHGTAASGPAPQRRALDAPLDSPPYPSSDWGYGGSPAIVCRTATPIR